MTTRLTDAELAAMRDPPVTAHKMSRALDEIAALKAELAILKSSAPKAKEPT